MLRKIIQINEELCDGCGECEIGCSEGAIKVINGKAKLVKEEYCDGFGDCLKECPRGAIRIITKEAAAFNENITKENLLKTKGYEAVWKMEESMKRHQESDSNNIQHAGCPGSRAHVLIDKKPVENNKENNSALRNWPVQLTLLPMKAPYYENADILIAADCCAHTFSNFHEKFLNNRTLAIGCPKLDDINTYQIKLSKIFGENNIKSVTVLYMEVPCCTGIVRAAAKAISDSGKSIPFKSIKLSLKGDILQEN
jgi:NAD-dependent dihydropyrimidine dehydrogenase PreA subunit